jgi:hypothetical protein
MPQPDATEPQIDATGLPVAKEPGQEAEQVGVSVNSGDAGRQVKHARFDVFLYRGAV